MDRRTFLETATGAAIACTFNLDTPKKDVLPEKIIFTVAVADMPNSNGNLYTKECLKSMVDDFNKTGLIPVYLGPRDRFTEMQLTAGMASDLTFDGKKLCCQIAFRDNKDGFSLKEIVRTHPDDIAIRSCSTFFDIDNSIDIDDFNGVFKINNAKLNFLFAIPVEDAAKWG